jgi:8-oxo-dGTP pyrophosphatase MutT (NUDIX family)
VILRDAATVMLVRDGRDGLEVFMLRRNLNSVFVGGAYVFPGGAVDGADRHIDLEPVCAGRSDEQASESLGIEAGGLAFWVAAIRECFEEAGVLLAYDEHGDMIRLGEASVARRFQRHRESVDRGERRLIEICAEERLRLAVDHLHYFSHWITPEGAPRRYDTRFFVCAAPPEQTALHDNREAIADIWIRPADALERYERGEFELIFPTVMSLQAIGRFDSSLDLLSAAAAAAEAPGEQPRLSADGHGVRIHLPGDADAARGAEPDL